MSFYQLANSTWYLDLLVIHFAVLQLCELVHFFLLLDAEEFVGLFPFNLADLLVVEDLDLRESGNEF